LGHIDIALRGANLASHLIVAVLDNSNKTPLFSTEERMALLQESLGHIKNIKIDSFSGLLVEYAKQKQATAILRGLRTPGDFETESRYAVCNGVLSVALSGQHGGETTGAERGVASCSEGAWGCNPHLIETIFLTASPSLSFISSSIVREAAFHISNNSALCNMVTPHVQKALENRIRQGE